MAAVDGRKLQVFAPMNTYVEKFFHSDEVQKIMEYQLVFLGSSPYNTPALYNIMSHIDFNMGVWYPRGGIPIDVFWQTGKLPAGVWAPDQGVATYRGRG